MSEHSDNMDKAAVNGFLNDLKFMSDDDIEDEKSDVQSKIDLGASWLEALSAEQRIRGISMFEVGMKYETLGGDTVEIEGMANGGESCETVFSIDHNGHIVSRYNRRDFGRVTGTDNNNPDPRNLRAIDLMSQ